MRTALFSFLGVLSGLCAVPAAAEQAPLRVEFQGRALDGQGVPRAGLAAIGLRLYDDPTGGALLWSETHPTVDVSSGFFRVVLGSWTALSIDLFSGTSVYLEVDVDPAGAEPPSTLLPRRRLLGAPYALAAAQLVSDRDLRVRAESAHSTFTALGNLRVPYGVEAGTLSLTGALTASSGTFLRTGDGQYSLVAASGVFVASGTLSAEGRGGVLLRYGLLAATGSFTAEGASTWSVQSASGARVAQGTLLGEGGGGAAARYGLFAATATFRATANDAYSLDASSGLRLQAGSLRLSDAQRTLHDEPSAGALLVTTNVVVAGSVSARDFDWVFLASATLESPAATLSVSFLSDGYQMLHVQIGVAGVVATCMAQLRFNGDAGNNYSSQIADNLGATTGLTSQAQMRLQEANNANAGFFDVWIKNTGGLGKVAYIQGQRGTNVAVVPFVYNGCGFWSGTAALNAIALFNSAATNFSSGTTLRVFGMR
ncbi:MAG: hypothetical protein WC969_09190 [Elusimicrobiota bacterium]|jgi:hypothetical protein